MKNHREIAVSPAPKRRRGRPRSAANTELIAALISKQDAMARRTAGKIEQILRTHVRLDAVEISWRRMCRDVRARLAPLPARAERACPSFRPGDRAVLEAMLAGITDEMDDGVPDDGSPLPEIPDEEGPPAVTSSSTLPEARAQLARLQVHLMALKARISRSGYLGPLRALVTRER